MEHQTSRRNFLKIAGSSAAVAGAGLVSGNANAAPSKVNVGAATLPYPTAVVLSLIHI